MLKLSLLLMGEQILLWKHVQYMKNVCSLLDLHSVSIQRKQQWSLLTKLNNYDNRLRLYQTHIVFIINILNKRSYINNVYSEL